MRTLASILLVMTLSVTSIAAPKPHLIAFGKFTSVKWFVGAEEMTAVELKVRPILVDARPKEFTSGPPHEITDRLFAVRRAFRVNDALSDEPSSSHQWKWQRGGWLLVDRLTGRISPINLPQFDTYLSAMSWYRDYAAYCGVSDDGKKMSALVIQLGRRKPLLKKVVGDVHDNDMPDSSCATPAWQRQPARVTFDVGNNEKFTFTVNGRALDVLDDEEPDPAE
jgi:hypothetical protein